MGRYTYTASLVNESIQILQRADQELSGTDAAVSSAIKTILNARGAERLSMDFDSILSLTDYARDDLLAVTREIQTKQKEIEEYENAPWWKKLFASIGMAILKFVEGRGEAIEYLFDLAISLAGFIGGLFNSEFKASCQEFVDKEHVNNWFTEQYLSDKGLASWANSYSVFSYDATAANIIEFGGSIVQSFYASTVTSPIGGAAALYKSFDNLMNTSDTNAIITKTPIIAQEIQRAFDVTEVDEYAIDNQIQIQQTTPSTNGEDEFSSTDSPNLPTDGGNSGCNSPIIDNNLFNDDKPTTPSSNSTETNFTVPTIATDSNNQYVSDNEIINSTPILNNNTSDETLQEYTQFTEQNISNSSVTIPKFNESATASIRDIMNQNRNIPTSSHPLNSKNDYEQSKKMSPLTSGGLAAGIAGLAVKSYVDKRDKSKEQKKEEIETDDWSQKDNLEVDYNYGNGRSKDADYLLPTDELAFDE